MNGEIVIEQTMLEMLHLNAFFRNIQSLKEHYPEYFNKHITFNSVLHNRNETQAVRKFIFDNFEKYPSISELNNFGIIDTQKRNF